MDKKRKKKLIVGIFIALFIISLGTVATRFGGDELDIVRPIMDYVTPTYEISVLGVKSTLEAGDTITVLINDIVSVDVKLHWDSTRNKPQQIQCKIIDSFYGIFYQDVAWDSVDNNGDYLWNFDLKDLPQGNYAYHFEFVGYYPDQESATSIYSGASIYFNINKYSPQISDIPSIWEEPDDFEMIDTTSKELVWEYQYGATGTITVSVDGVVKATKDITGSSAGQIYRFTFNPVSVGSYVIQFTLDPDYSGHSTVYSTVYVNAVTFEEYYLLDGLPNAVDGVAIRIDGQMSVIGWGLTHQWIELDDVVPSDVYSIPKTGNLKIVVVGELNGGYVITNFEEVKVIVRNPTVSDKTFDFDLQIEAEPLWYSYMFGAVISSWYEANINLDDFAAGEYEFNLRCKYSGAWYNVSTFTITVNTFPIGWLVGNAGLILVIGAVSIIFVKVIREGKGWWYFQGKYGKYNK